MNNNYKRDPIFDKRTSKPLETKNIMLLKIHKQNLKMLCKLYFILDS